MVRHAPTRPTLLALLACAALSSCGAAESPGGDATGGTVVAPTQGPTAPQSSRAERLTSGTVPRDATIPQNRHELAEYLRELRRCVLRGEEGIMPRPSGPGEVWDLCEMSLDAVWEECADAPNVNCGDE
jgi:hypothetical protein